jgi:hypothetical protein
MADDLLATNLQKIDDILATKEGDETGLDQAIQKHLDEARAAQASGDTKQGIAITSKILERLEMSSS